MADPRASAATELDLKVAPLLARHPDHSAAALLRDNTQAFALRARAARSAGRSLDAQYYIWHDDLTGRLLKHELVSAAERGVRVRLLIDDMNFKDGDEALRAMDAHPNLEVRLFNPARNRATSVQRAIEMLLRFVGFNRRMHNKAWIVDGRVAIVGGRNIGDEYFDAAAEVNFHDADLLLLGPAVAQSASIFDRFWNSAEVVPLAALHDKPPALDDAALRRVRAGWLAQARDSAYLQALGERASLQADIDELRVGPLALHWMRELQVVSDPPEKAAPLAQHRSRERWLLLDVLTLLFSAREQSLLKSPYFVPGDAGVLMFAGQAARGIDVRVLTNSLAATDVPVVHAGYRAYRRPLLAGGVKLYEQKPGSHSGGTDLIGSSGASLHTKSIVVDGRRGFVGSFNFDPRSVALNTEMGVLFDHPALAAELRASFDAASAPDMAYAVRIDSEGRLRWQDGEREWRHEPQTSRWRRALVAALGLLPIESQL